MKDRSTTLGGVLVLFSLVPSVVGVLALTKGVFSVIVVGGIGFLLSGIFIFCGKKAGKSLFLITYAILVIGTVMEAGFVTSVLISRLLIPTLFALFVVGRQTR